MGVLEQIQEQQERILSNQEGILARLERVESHGRLHQEWYTLPECARLKGMSDTYLRNHVALQPLGGIGRQTVNGLEKWHRLVVAEWLGQDDDTLIRGPAIEPELGGRRTSFFPDAQETGA